MGTALPPKPQGLVHLGHLRSLQPHPGPENGRHALGGKTRMQTRPKHILSGFSWAEGRTSSGTPNPPGGRHVTSARRESRQHGGSHRLEVWRKPAWRAGVSGGVPGNSEGGTSPPARPAHHPGCVPFRCPVPATCAALGLAGARAATECIRHALHSSSHSKSNTETFL